MSLPNPTEDLDWGGYLGGIHEIFHKNAVAHPDRPCVIETKTSKCVMSFCIEPRPCQCQ